MASDILAQPLVSQRTTVLLDDPYFPLSIKQYHAMIQSGILTEDDPVELLEGRLAYKMPKNPRHRRAKRRLQKALEQILPPDWYVDEQEPITLSDSEPEPDIVVARGDSDDYPDSHPGPEDVALVVEISEATLKRDQGSKKRLYARAGVPVYWIVNLVANRIEVYTNPTEATHEPDYRQRQQYGLEDSVPVVINELEIGRLAVRALLP